MNECPKYLKEYEGTWRTDPRKAKLEWFRDAGYGLFLHYGLYSLLHDREWIQFFDKIPVAEYEKLAGQFTAHNFDADYGGRLHSSCSGKDSAGSEAENRSGRISRDGGRVPK